MIFDVDEFITGGVDSVGDLASILTMGVVSPRYADWILFDVVTSDTWHGSRLICLI